jgi:hypothetical protein
MPDALQDVRITTSDRGESEREHQLRARPGADMQADADGTRT